MNHADFQTAFWRDLWSADEPTSSALARQPGFAVYRNTVLKACVDTLLALYPAVRRRTGDDRRAAAARAHARDHPPQAGG
ncbi:MAG: putative DNA-binding domain-containing protein, partial [Hydrogenophaga sp.]|uniref:HvfC/BufC family peptide modification chaperone n=1 Tax=Hydrogenophaga sp. TaxID=1904254 RepID=UPI002621F2C6